MKKMFGLRRPDEVRGRHAPIKNCHGGPVAHNIEYDMVSHWETMGFRSICSQYYAPYPPRQFHYISTSMAKGLGLSLDNKDDDEWSQSNLGSMFRSWSFLFIGLRISLFSTKLI